LKKRTKKLLVPKEGLLVSAALAKKAKVFCFFFSKKKYFLASPVFLSLRGLVSEGLCPGLPTLPHRSRNDCKRFSNGIAERERNEGIIVEVGEEFFGGNVGFVARDGGFGFGDQFGALGGVGGVGDVVEFVGEFFVERG
jgi:hypothetical protein